MVDSQQNEIKNRRLRRNTVVGWVLAGFVVLIFAVTIVKLTDGNSLEGFDHTMRPSLLGKDQ